MGCMPQFEEPLERMTFFSIWLCRAGEGASIWWHCRIMLHPKEEEGEAQTNEKGEREREKKGRGEGKGNNHTKRGKGKRGREKEGRGEGKKNGPWREEE